MRKTLNIFHLLVILTLLLAACAPAAATASTSETVSGIPNTNAASADNPTSPPPNEPPSGNGGPGNPPSGNPPSGNPPSGNGGPGNPPPGAGTGSSNIEEGLATATGAYTLNGSNATLSDQVFTASNEDQSGVYVTDGGVLTLNNVIVTTSGDTSSDENSSFYGLNAGILATSGSVVTVNSGTINTTGSGANGAFAAGDGSVVNLTKVTINASGDGGHGVMATLGGEMTLTDVDMTTSGAHSAPIATDRGSGKITAVGGTLITSGDGSPCYYSTGVLNIADSTCKSSGSEVAVIEGANSVTLTNSNLTSTDVNGKGVMIYQSFSGDAEGSDGVFTMTGGSLAYTDANGPLFYVTNTKGYINLTEVDVTAASDILLKAEGNDRWGTSGSNGGTVFFTADNQTLSGDFLADGISSISLTLKNGSPLTGAINADNSAKSASLTLDSSSVWTVTADSHLTSLVNPDGINGNGMNNIIGNGHTVYYDADNCPELDGKTYDLVGGGTLTPSK